jgi:hypothetical protein
MNNAASVLPFSVTSSGPDSDCQFSSDALTPLAFGRLETGHISILDHVGVGWIFAAPDVVSKDVVAEASRWIDEQIIELV